MKPLRLIALVMALGLSTYGQAVNVTANKIKGSATAPSGACTAQSVQLTTAGVLWTCASGTWSSSGGGGTTINSTNGQVPYRVNSTTFGDSAISSNALNATGISVTSAAAGSGVTIGVTSSGSSENLILLPKGTGTSFSSRPIFVGADGSTTNSVDSWFTINRLVNDATPGAGVGINGHAFSDSSVVSRTGTIGYASYDARFTATGTTNFDHFAMFQSAPTIGTSGTTSEIYGLYHLLAINTGAVTSAYGLYVAASTGTGTIGTEYGIKVKTLTKGTTRYGIYVEGNNSYFNGQVQIGLNTPGYLSAPSDGAISITAAGTNKDITFLPSGTGRVVVSGTNFQVNGGYIYSDRTSTPAYIINTGGSNYGQIFTQGTTGFSLGYNTIAGVSGTAVLSWFSTGRVGIGTTNPDATLDVNIGTTGSFQLTYNDNNGGAVNKVNLAPTSNGNLTIIPSGGLVSFVGETSSFPALKRSSAELQVRLADDTAFAAIQSLYVRYGAGSPEGAVTAPVGAIYSRTDGGAGTSFYVKESGAGNTGWVSK